MYWDAWYGLAEGCEHGEFYYPGEIGKMKKIIVFLIACMLCAPCLAAPKKSDAEKWYQDFRGAKDKVFDRMFITKTGDHTKLSQQIAMLTKRAEKLFGRPFTSDIAVCTQSAISLEEVWAGITEINRATQVNKMTPSHIASMAWNGGEDYPTCIDLIDKLK